MDFDERNLFEIQKMVEHILETATHGLQWARKREVDRLDHEQGFVEWGPGDKNDEGYLIEELAEPLPTHLSMIKRILLLQAEQLGSDEQNVVRFRELLSAGKITYEFVFNFVAACCDFYAFGWIERHTAGQPPFRHYRAAPPVTSWLADCDREFQENSAVAR